ncbi:MAG: threonine--tRNA ligase [Thermoanaerobaculia bacterium]|nr:threonine--tRNA ligase [Thermoanaerobaculia bacterium]
MERPQPADEHLYRIRHSLAHVMAQAVLELYPEAKLGIGPPIEHGFYYDFDLGTEGDRPRTFKPEDLAEIEQRMRRIISENHAFTSEVVSEEEARHRLAAQPYKLELVDGLVGGQINEDGVEVDEPPPLSFYRQASFQDLCRGPHVETTRQIPPDAFQLTSVAAAYWRGDEHQPMLQRLYGTGWRNKKELKAYLQWQEEAKKRDHRKLGKQLEIFTFDAEIGAGLPLWLPNGGILIEELEKLAKEVEQRAGYVRVATPLITKEGLFHTSGHLPYYKEGMFPPIEMEGTTYYLKPMNCPFHHKIFAARPRSYRELPLRVAEYGTCHRFEPSGDLFGLMRVRSMRMNDAHIYCSRAQFEQEFLAVVQMYLGYFKLFGIDEYVMRLSTHHKRGLGKKYVDNEPLWHETEELVRTALRHAEVPFVEVADEAAFYGPKIDVQVHSSIGKEFTLATNQVDFAQPGRFGLHFINAAGEKEEPLVIHRAPLSTHERMIGFLIEHYGGAFPVWLAPEQVRVVPINDACNDFAQQLVERCREAGIRASADLGSERMNAKIRDAQLMKVPYMPVIGEREMAAGVVSLRKRDGSQVHGLAVDALVEMVEEKIATRSGEI